MKKIWKWVKEHVRPYYKYNQSYNDGRPEKDNDNTNNRLDDLKENSEIGIKIKFKF